MIEESTIEMIEESNEIKPTLDVLKSEAEISLLKVSTLERELNLSDEEKLDLANTISAKLKQKYALEDEKKQVTNSLGAKIKDLELSIEELNTEYVNNSKVVFNKSYEVKNYDNNTMEYYDFETLEFLDSRPLEESEMQMGIEDINMDNDELEFNDVEGENEPVEAEV